MDHDPSDIDHYLDSDEDKLDPILDSCKKTSLVLLLMGQSLKQK